MDGLSFDSIDEAEASWLEGDSEEREVWEVVKAKNGDKAPSPDGFSLAFFQACWVVLNEDIMKVFHDFHASGKFERRIFLAILLSLFFRERSSPPFFQNPLLPPSFLLLLWLFQGRREETLFPPPFLFSSFPTSSSLSLYLSGFLGFFFFLGVVLGGWVFSGSFQSLPSTPFPWLAAALSCVGFGSFRSWVVDLLCLGPPTSARASQEVSPSWSGFPRRWRCCGWTPRAVPALVAEVFFEVWELDPRCWGPLRHARAPSEAFPADSATSNSFSGWFSAAPPTATRWGAWRHAPPT